MLRSGCFFEYVLHMRVTHNRVTCPARIVTITEPLQICDEA